MKRPWIWIFPAVLLISMRGVSAAGRPLDALIEHAVLSEGSIAYQGTQLLEERGAEERMATVRKVWFDRGRSRIEFTDPRMGLERVMIEDGQCSFHVVPRLGMYGQTRSDHQQVLERRAQMLRNMLNLPHTRIAGEARLLERMCTVVESRTESGGSIVWIDRETGLPLRLERENKGRLVYRLAFTEISFISGLPEETFKAPIDSGMKAYSRPLVFERDVRLMVLSRDAGVPVYIPRGIPEAARVSESEVMRFRGRPLIHVQFRMKQVVFSLFQLAEDANNAEIQEGIRSRARSAAGLGKLEICEWRVGGRRFILIGNLTAVQLRRMAMTQLEEFAWK